MKKKKIFAILLSVTLAAGVFSACGSSSNNEVESISVKTSESQETLTEQTASEETSSEATEESKEADPYEGLTLYESAIGVSLYMCEGFSEETIEGIELCYNGENSGMTCQEETFESLAGVGYNGAEMTLEEYARLILDAYQLEGEVLTDEYGNTYITYVKDVQGTDITYYGYFDKGSTAFWSTTFMCIGAEAELYAKDFPLWASSIQVP